MSGGGGDIQFGVRITADNQVFVNEVKASEEQVKKLGQGLQQVAEDAKGATKSQESLTGAVFKGNIALDAAEKVASLVGDAFRVMREEALATEIAQRKLTTVLQATSYASLKTAEDIDRLSEAMAQSTFFDNNQLKDAAAQLATFSEIAGTSFDRVMRSGANLATLFGGDVTSRTLAVARALTEPATSLGQLERVIGKFSPELREYVKLLSDMGDVSAAQTLILDELEKKTGNVAEAMHTGLRGATDELTKSWRDLLGELGKSGPIGDAAGVAVKALADHVRNLKGVMESGGWAATLVALMNPAAARELAGNSFRGVEGGSSSTVPAPVDPRRLEDQNHRATLVAIANSEKRAAAAKKAAEEIARIRAAALREEYRDLDQLNEAMGRRVLSLQDEADKAEQANRTWGMSKSAIEDLTIARVEDRIEALRGMEGSEASVKALELEIAARKRLRDAYQATEGRVEQEKEAQRALAAAQEQARQQASMLGELAGFLSTAVVNFAAKGHNALRELRRDVQQLIADMFKVAGQRWLLQVVGALTGSAGLAAQAGSVGAGTLSGAGAGLLGNAASWAGGATGATAFAGDVAAGYSLAGTTGVAAAQGTAGFSIGEAAAVFGPYALAAAAVIAAVMYFAGKGGGPKTEGSSFGEYDVQGNFVGSRSVPGTDNGRFFTAGQQDAQMRSMSDSFAESYFAAVARLGGSSGGSASFGIGMARDTQGDAQSMLSMLAQVNGRTAFNLRDSQMGRDMEDIQKEIADQIPRMLLASLQASDWSQARGVGNILSTVDASTATQDAIKGVMDLADAFATMTKAMDEVDLDTFVKDLAKGPNERFEDMGRSLLELSGRTKISVESLNQLSKATGDYKGAVAQLLAGFEQAKQEISSMFGETVRSIRMSNLDPQGRYNFLQGEADQLLTQLQGSSSASEIQSLAERINRNINDAFSLLSPEQQRAMENEYLTRIENTNRLVQDRLSQQQAETSSESNRILNEIKAAMDLKAEDFKRAAGDFRAGVDNLTGQGMHVDIDVEVFDNRATASVVNGG